MIYPNPGSLSGPGEPGTYLQNKVSWAYFEATNSFPTYGKGGPNDKKGKVKKGQLFRVYQGKIGTPWYSGTQKSGLLIKTPSANDFMAIELPTRAG